MDNGYLQSSASEKAKANQKEHLPEVALVSISAKVSFRMFLEESGSCCSTSVELADVAKGTVSFVLETMCQNSPSPEKDVPGVAV